MGIRKNIALQALTQVTSRGLGFLFFLIAARLLGAEDFGLFSFALGVGALLAVLMDFGMDTLLVKWSARGQAEVVVASFHGRTTLSIGVCLLFIAFVLAFIQSNQLLLCLVAIYFALLINIQTHTACFRGIEKMHLESWVMILQKAAALLFVLLALRLANRPVSAALSLVLSASLGLAAARLAVQRHRLQPLLASYGSESCRNLRIHLTSILRESLPLLLVVVGWNIYFRIDIVMLKAYVTNEQIGYYSAAYKIMEGIGIFPSILLAALFPALSRRSIQAPAEARRLFVKALTLLAPAALLLCGTFYALADFFLVIIYGREYAPAVPLFRILIWSILAIFPGYLVTQSLIAYDKNIHYSVITLLAAALNIALNLLLIPRFGACGAAWATVATEVFVSILCLTVMANIFFAKARWR